MALVVIVLVLAAVAVAAVLASRRMAAAKNVGPSIPEVPADPFSSDNKWRSNPRNLRVADVVMLDGRDFIVRGTIRFDQDGFVWHEHFLDDLEVKRWLSVEDDEGLEIVLWESLKGVTLEPGAGTLDHAGATYQLDEHGHARFTAQGTTGTAPAGQVEYYDYTAGDARLSFERYGSGDWEVGLGTVVGEHTLDIYPGSD